MGERRWFLVGIFEINLLEPKISRQFTNIFRSKPHFHVVDVTCQWRSVMQKVREWFQNIDPIGGRNNVNGVRTDTSK